MVKVQIGLSVSMTPNPADKFWVGLTSQSSGTGHVRGNIWNSCLVLKKDWQQQRHWESCVEKVCNSRADLSKVGSSPLASHCGVCAHRCMRWMSVWVVNKNGHIWSINVTKTSEGQTFFYHLSLKQTNKKYIYIVFLLFCFWVSMELPPSSCCSRGTVINLPHLFIGFLSDLFLPLGRHIPHSAPTHSPTHSPERVRSVVWL